MALAEHFKNKAKDPFGLLEKLVEHHEKQVNGETVVSPAPTFVPKPVPIVHKDPNFNQMFNLMGSII